MPTVSSQSIYRTRDINQHSSTYQQSQLCDTNYVVPREKTTRVARYLCLAFCGTKCRSVPLQEGPFAFWRGLRPNILAAVPTVGIYMPLYDHLHTIFTPTAGAAAPLAAGVCSRTAAVLLVAPLELVRTRIMAVPATPRALLVAATPNLPVSFSFPQHSVLWPTVTGLWRGVGATVRFFFLRIIENYPKS